MHPEKDHTREPALAEGPGYRGGGVPCPLNVTWPTSRHPADVDRGRGFTTDAKVFCPTTENFSRG